MDEQLKIDHQLCFPLYAAARRTVALYTPHLKPLGLTYTQYIVFLVLWEQDGLTVGDIGHKLRLDNGTLTPLLKKMEEQGFLTRARSAEDERVVLIHLTEKGRALREKARGIPQKIGSCLRIPPDSAATLYTLLYQLMDAIDRPT